MATGSLSVVKSHSQQAHAIRRCHRQNPLAVITDSQRHHGLGDSGCDQLVRLCRSTKTGCFRRRDQLGFIAVGHGKVHIVLRSTASESVDEQTATADALMKPAGSRNNPCAQNPFNPSAMSVKSDPRYQRHAVLVPRCTQARSAFHRPPKEAASTGAQTDPVPLTRGRTDLRFARTKNSAFLVTSDDVATVRRKLCQQVRSRRRMRSRCGFWCSRIRSRSRIRSLWRLNRALVAAAAVQSGIVTVEGAQGICQVLRFRSATDSVFHLDRDFHDQQSTGGAAIWTPADVADRQQVFMTETIHGRRAVRFDPKPRCALAQAAAVSVWDSAPAAFVRIPHRIGECDHTHPTAQPIEV